MRLGGRLAAMALEASVPPSLTQAGKSRQNVQGVPRRMRWSSIDYGALIGRRNMHNQRPVVPRMAVQVCCCSAHQLQQVQ
jgi:hypothetical protein